MDTRRLLYTPPLQSGCIAGVSRRIVLEYFEKQGITVHQVLQNAHRLLEADLVFMTNSSGLFVCHFDIHNKKSVSVFWQNHLRNALADRFWKSEHFVF